MIFSIKGESSFGLEPTIENTITNVAIETSFAIEIEHAVVVNEAASNISIKQFITEKFSHYSSQTLREIDEDTSEHTTTDTTSSIKLLNISSTSSATEEYSSSSSTTSKSLSLSSSSIDSEIIGKHESKPDIGHKMSDPNNYSTQTNYPSSTASDCSNEPISSHSSSFQKCDSENEIRNPSEFDQFTKVKKID